MSREIVQQIVIALKALMTGYVGDAEDAIYAIEKELAKPEQEPVNTMPTKIFGPNLEQILNAAGFYRREWVGLTNDEINDFSAGCHLGKSVQSAICQAAAKLKEKNNA